MLNSDAPLTDPIENRWVRARNILLADDFKTPVNEAGDTSIGANYNGFLPSQYSSGNWCGKIETPKETILFADNHTIYRFVNDTLYPIIHDTRFNFSTANPITGVYKYDNFNNLIVAWTDGVNEPCILNVDNLPFAMHVDYTIDYPAGSDADDYFSLANIFPYVKAPIFKTVSVIPGGNLSKGVYYIFIRYGYGNNTWGAWSSICSNPIPIGDLVKSASTYITSGGTTQLLHEFTGISEAELTSYLDSSYNQSIRFQVSNIDTKFKEFQYGFLHISAKGVTSASVSPALRSEITLHSYTLSDNLNTIGYSSILSDFFYFRG